MEIQRTDSHHVLAIESKGHGARWSVVWDWLAGDNSAIFGLKNSADGTQFAKCVSRGSDI